MQSETRTITLPAAKNGGGSLRKWSMNIAPECDVGEQQSTRWHHRDGVAQMVCGTLSR